MDHLGRNCDQVGTIKWGPSRDQGGIKEGARRDQVGYNRDQVGIEEAKGLFFLSTVVYDKPGASMAAGTA